MARCMPLSLMLPLRKSLGPARPAELLGALFLAGDNYNRSGWYQEDIFAGQLGTVRWWEFYFRT